jgi:hypothetical protein
MVDEIKRIIKTSEIMKCVSLGPVVGVGGLIIE